MIYLQAKEQLSDCEELLHDIQMFEPGFGKVWAIKVTRLKDYPRYLELIEKSLLHKTWVLRGFFATGYLAKAEVYGTSH
jgi:hypothetical protein